LLVDTHTHLNAPEFDEDRDDVIQRALDAGVERMVVIGFDVDTSRMAIDLASRYEGIFAVVGIHPCYVQHAQEGHLADIERLLSHPKVVGVGETGIDLHWDKSTYRLQDRFFRKHIELGRRFNLPVIVHDREAHDEVLSILDTEQASDMSVVLHCFTGDLAMAEQAIRAGYFLGFGGIVTFKNSNLADVIAGVPADHLLIETDAPYLAPSPFRGRRNEPAYVVKTAEAIAQIRGLSLNELAQITTQNAQRVFKHL